MNQPKKVYVLIEGDYDWTKPLVAFSSEEQARLIASTLAGAYVVCPLNLDPDVSYFSGTPVKTWCVRFRYGQPPHVTQIEPCGYDDKLNKFQAIVPQVKQLELAPTLPTKDWMVKFKVTCLAEDDVKAIEVAKQMLAEQGHTL